MILKRKIRITYRECEGEFKAFMMAGEIVGHPSKKLTDMIFVNRS
jgi:hypothetical protein